MAASVKLILRASLSLVERNDFLLIKLTNSKNKVKRSFN